ncbi:MAG: ABC transporter substrate-binding protein [Rhodospirillales bacterium]|nr:ABC transporter substrate-binding protein [Rhodospirillales bacterium]MCW8951647.1 ABC transporter substrate-binding protein [Rhodospirillales bacterium]MCW8970288.1 ABC transporter substrate-binding protein [Rhodospirillales bacterium]MCW9001471.1 ABC transporter substrate-binding protein [Rhodospirillales bacterium]
MNFKKLATFAAAAIIATPLFATGAKAYELVVPSLDYRTGPYAPSGIPYANGFADYLTLLNEKGGIEGVKVKLVPCETGYNTKVGVECYEKVKDEAPSRSLVVHPLSTGITYQLIPKASSDQIPIHSMGYGRTSAVNGAVFPWVFNFPATYWDGAAVFVKYIGEKSGGMDKLKGKKIALVYHNSAYGKEPIRTLESMGAKYGFNVMLLPVDHPGQEQKATWLQVRREKPDWVLMWGWGVMNQVAIKEASSIRFPMDRFIGIWWSGSEQDVLPAGDDAHGYLSGAFTAPGDGFPLHAEIKKVVYGANKGAGEADRVGEVGYNRGIIAGVYFEEAVRTAMKIHKTKEVTPAMVRDGYESLNLTEARLNEIGLPNFAQPVQISCDNHAGPRKVAIQRWDAKAKKFDIISKWYDTDREITDALIAEDSAAYAKENNITPKCM